MPLKSLRTAVAEKGKSEGEGKDFPINALKAYGEAEVKLHSFLSSVLDG
jgi:hypothetical protein